MVVDKGALSAVAVGGVAVHAACLAEARATYHPLRSPPLLSAPLRSSLLTPACSPRSLVTPTCSVEAWRVLLEGGLLVSFSLGPPTAPPPFRQAEAQGAAFEVGPPVTVASSKAGESVLCYFARKVARGGPAGRVDCGASPPRRGPRQHPCVGPYMM